MTQRSKYILLEKVLLEDENGPFEVPVGEILEEIDSSDYSIWSSDVFLFHARRQRKLTFSTKAVARLTDLHAANLLSIKSLKQRLTDFQARNCFAKPPKTGNQVFVSVRGREFKGIVRAVSSMSDNDSSFKVQLFNEVNLDEHFIQDGETLISMKTCGLDVLWHLPNGGIGVSVSLDKLRPRYETLSSNKHQTRAVRGEIENEKNRLLNSCQKSNMHKVALATKTEANDKEHERQLSCTKKDKEEAEKQLQSSEEKTKHLETTLPIASIDQQNYKNLQLKFNKLQQANGETQKRLQSCEEREQELQKTLAETQKLVKKKQEPDNECEWTLNREEIQITEEKLGSGTFGTVYKGMFRGTQVAVKQVSVKPKITEYNIENFRREMKMASRCRHPCMLQFIGATSDDQSPLLMTELLDTSLKAVLLERALNLVEIITIALDVAKGLNYLHLTRPHPIVHRDISSGNVLLWKHGQSWRGKISDYGNAVLMNYAKTGSGGAISYLAPEMNNKRFSPKSDVFSFGVLLLEMCLRKEPSCLGDRGELICLVENGELRSLIRSCLQKEPTQRPSMDEVLAALTTASSSHSELTGTN
ncbi:serine/threonine/tyrosine-protein kinase HT1-like [Actinia tenebrosa]|uniref:Serine/threonine/tyrosine-protein kinase HT1-like n=1 Tax=Actinia tenebrosa TaxID=6105 RepID=A0A6P8HG93_ACTTE|nr:serine/threonine/tyrosine-protein kinase HT1-like [Actinia tenebrosa]